MFDDIVLKRILAFIGKGMSKQDARYKNVIPREVFDERHYHIHACEGHRDLNKVALVGHLFHNALVHDCPSLLRRKVFISFALPGRCLRNGHGFTMPTTLPRWWHWVQLWGANEGDLCELVGGEIKELDLQFCKDLARIQCINRWPLLTALNLSHCPLITDTTLTAISESCRNMQILKMAACYGIGDTGVAAVLELPSLVHLDLACCNVSGNSFHCLQFTSTGLAQLNITGCKCITPEAISNITKGCPRITSLALRSCDQINDLCLTGIVADCKYLKVLDLHNCIMITERVVKLIAASPGSIVQLNLTACPNISVALLEQLMASGIHPTGPATNLDCFTKFSYLI